MASHLWTNLEKSTSEMSEKSFDNLYEEALSPRARSPMFDSKKLERMEKELAADRTRLHNVFGRIFFYLNCIFGIKYFFLLPLTLIHNGGCGFFLPHPARPSARTRTASAGHSYPFKAATH